MIPEINFFLEGVSYRLSDKKKIKSWILETFQQEGKSLEAINLIFCNDSYLLNLNKIHLKHFDLTDILTFSMHETDRPIIGDVYISLERVRENAGLYNETMKNELRRVIIHGVLHLCGYDDKAKSEQLLMREKENFYLNQFQAGQ